MIEDYLKYYFDKTDFEFVDDRSTLSKNQSLYSRTYFYDSETDNPNLDDFQLAIFGVKEDRNSINYGSALSPSEIRKHLYILNSINSKISIFDAGDLKPGKTVDDTIYAIRDICTIFIKKKIIPIILGGIQDVALGCYLAFENLDEIIKATSIDSLLNLTLPGGFGDSYLKKVILDHGQILYNHTNIAYQNYLSSIDDIRMIDQVFFDKIRLGEISKNIDISEPFLRDSDLVIIDVRAISQNSMPAQPIANPNGLQSDEICKLAWFTGLGNCRCFGLFGLNPDFDNNSVGSALAGQIIWHFVDGISSRKKEHPFNNPENFKKYYLSEKTGNKDLVFFESYSTGRWWASYGNSSIKESFVPVLYEDYIIATEGNIPDSIWKNAQKL